MSPCIRLARPPELGTLQGIERAAATLIPPGRLPDPEQTRSLEELERCRALGLLWVAEGDGAPAGFIMAEPLDGGLHVLELAVHPRCGRRGIGTALMGHAIAAARGNGWPRVTLTTFEDLPWNAPWYQRLGFCVLDPEALPAVLLRVLAAERSAGLTRRVAMGLTVAPRP